MTTNSSLYRGAAALALDEATDWSVLMARAQDGDKPAYGRLLREVTPICRAIAGRAFRSREDVEDVVQEILLTIHQVRHTYDPQRPFQPWLLAIARRRVVDRIRRRSRIAAVEQPLAAEHEETFSDERTNPVETVWDPEALRLAIAALPPGQRQAVEMLKLKEMSLKEASAASGLSIAALKVAGHRAYKALRLALAKRSDAL